MADRVGQQLGNYRLLRVLGQGAFAEVYLGEHLYLERPAAIKVLHVQLEPKTHEQFRREARTIAHLQHPHIVQVHDFGFADQTPYLVMEYTSGGTLRSQHPKGTPLPFEQIVTYVKQIASALDYAHQQRVIHRDVKPANLLLNARCEVVLSDFGLAVVQRTLESLSTQEAAGTPLYMAPEQIQGKPCPQSDQYALGIMVYQWLCGEPPFQGQRYAVLGQHLSEPPPSLRERLPALPVAVEEAVFKAFAKDPEQRFSCVADFASALEHACSASQPLTLQVLAQPQTDGSFSTEPEPLTMPRAGRGQEAGALLVPGLLLHPQSGSKGVKPSLAQSNRQRFLRRVRTFWIDGVLEHSLHGAALIALGLQEQLDALANPWHLVLQHPDTAPRAFPAGTRITEVYDAANGELLILGAPGSGKTTLLLEVARNLLARAEHDEQHLLPVVFPLSSWAAKPQPLAEWMMEELSTKYDVPRTLARTWVDTDQILPLLDGLDEVVTEKRTACIETINTYHQEHAFLPLVISSRSADYLAQTARVKLTSAVTIQPLTQEQVDEYLAQAGESLWALRVALHQDAALRELAETPLMLSILTLTYHGLPVEELLRGGIAPTRQQVFERYTQRMLSRRGTASSYSLQQTRGWLAWLAGQMKRQGQTVFYIEHLQPNWLTGDLMRRTYYRWAVRFPAILMGVLVSLAISSSLSFFNYALDILPILSIVPGGFIGWLQSARSMTQQLNESSGKDSEGTWFRPSFWPWAGIVALLSAETLFGLQLGLLTLALSLVLSAGLLSMLLIGKPVGIFLTEELVWSWKSLKRSLLAKRHMSITLLILALIGLSVGLSVGLSRSDEAVLSCLCIRTNIWMNVNVGLNDWLSAGLSAGLSYWLLLGLFQGVSGETVGDHHRLVPNQGIHRSARNGLIFGLISTAIVLLTSALNTGLHLNIGPSVGLSFSFSTTMLSIGLVTGISAGLLTGLLNGGLACLRHSVIRLLLWRAGSIPWNYPRFLNYTAERILLRKVGGGYIFVHRLLLEYFASLDTTATPDPTRAKKE